MFVGADANLFEKAKRLRKQQTPAEGVLWQYLRQKPFGYKFRRQHPFGIYILDFYCHEHQLGIEIDGKIHEHEVVKANDLQRENILKHLGLTIIRFTNYEIEHSRERVFEYINTFLQTNSVK